MDTHDRNGYVGNYCYTNEKGRETVHAIKKGDGGTYWSFCGIISSHHPGDSRDFFKITCKSCLRILGLLYDDPISPPQAPSPPLTPDYFLIFDKGIDTVRPIVAKTTEKVKGVLKEIYKSGEYRDERWAWRDILRIVGVKEVANYHHHIAVKVELHKKRTAGEGSICKNPTCAYYHFKAKGYCCTACHPAPI